jgi:hypothetical protein
MNKNDKEQDTFLKELFNKIPEAGQESKTEKRTSWIASEQSCNTESEY